MAFGPNAKGEPTDFHPFNDVGCRIQRRRGIANFDNHVWQ
jgi:hypothetical protein